MHSDIPTQQFLDGLSQDTKKQEQRNLTDYHSEFISQISDGGEFHSHLNYDKIKDFIFRHYGLDFPR